MAIKRKRARSATVSLHKSLQDSCLLVSHPCVTPLLCGKRLVHACDQENYCRKKWSHFEAQTILSMVTLSLLLDCSPGKAPAISKAVQGIPWGGSPCALRFQHIATCAHHFEIRSSSPSSRQMTMTIPDSMMTIFQETLSKIYLHKHWIPDPQRLCKIINVHHCLVRDYNKHTPFKQKMKII